MQPDGSANERKSEMAATKLQSGPDLGPPTVVVTRTTSRLSMPAAVPMTGDQHQFKSLDGKPPRTPNQSLLDQQQQLAPARPGQRALSRSSRTLPSPDSISQASTEALAEALAHESPDVRGLVVDAINQSENMNRFDVVTKVRQELCRTTQSLERATDTLRFGGYRY